MDLGKAPEIRLAAGREGPDGLDEPDGAFLHQVAYLHALLTAGRGQAHDGRHEGLDQPVLARLVAAAGAAQELVLLCGIERFGHLRDFTRRPF